MIKRISESAVCVMLVLALIGCSQSPTSALKENASKLMALQSGRDTTVEEVSPPEVIQKLRLAIDSHTPKVKILGIKPNATLEDTMVTVRFDVDDFPLFKDPDLALGPHLHVFLDDRPYQAVYDANQSLTFKDLSPGTHTIRAFASRPWHESVKSPDAYDQVTFNVFAPTQANQPDPTQPLLTYSRPEGVYGAEPIMVDYYLTPSSTGNNRPPKVRVSLNGKSFTTDEWTPIYLKGFQPGFNWVKLELLDANDKLASNVYSETIRLIEFNPNGTDSLSKLVRGDLTAQAAERIVDPKVSQRLADQKRESQPSPEPSPKVNSLEPKGLPTPEAIPTMEVSPSPATIAPIVPKPLIAKPTVSPEPQPRKAIVRPTPTPKPIASPAPLMPKTVKVLEKAEIPSVDKPLEIEPKLKSATDKPFWSKFNPKQFLGDKLAPSKDEVKELTVAEPKMQKPSPSPIALPTKTVEPAIAKPAVTPVKELEVKPSVNPSPSPSPVGKKSAVEKTASDWQDFLQLQRTNIDKAPLLKTTEPPKLPSRYLKKAEPDNVGPETMLTP